MVKDIIISEHLFVHSCAPCTWQNVVGSADAMKRFLSEHSKSFLQKIGRTTKNPAMKATFNHYYQMVLFKVYIRSYT